MEDIFEKASRAQLRFTSVKGNLTTEDLWHLPLRSDTGRPNLNDIAKSLNKSIRENEEQDFVEVPGRTAQTGTDPLALEVVKKIIAVKQTEATEASTQADRKAQKQKLLELLERKRTEALSDLTIEELQAQIGAL